MITINNDNNKSRLLQGVSKIPAQIHTNKITLLIIHECDKLQRRALNTLNNYADKSRRGVTRIPRQAIDGSPYPN